MRRLKIDLQELAMSFEDSASGSEFHRSYLDLETGRVIFIEARVLEDLEGEDWDSLEEGADAADMPGEADWPQETRAGAREVIEHLGHAIYRSAF